MKRSISMSKALIKNFRARFRAQIMVWMFGIQPTTVNLAKTGANTKCIVQRKQRLTNFIYLINLLQFWIASHLKYIPSNCNLAKKPKQTESNWSEIKTIWLFYASLQIENIYLLEFVFIEMGVAFKVKCFNQRMIRTKKGFPVSSTSLVEVWQTYVFHRDFELEQSHYGTFPVFILGGFSSIQYK